MGSILLEAPTYVWPPTTKMINAFAQQKSLKQQKNFLDTNILPHKKFRNLFGIRPIIVHSMMISGIDPDKNRFLNFVCKIPFKMPDAKSYKNKMQYVYDSYNNKKLDLKLPILLEPSLWNRSDSDFRYSLNVFNIFSQPKLVSSYLKDTSVVNLSQFMNGSEVKPAGQNGEDGDTIYNVIEDWSKDNEYSTEEREERKKAAEKEKEKEKEQDGKNASNGSNANNIKWDYDYFKGILEKVFSSGGSYTKTLGSKNDYLERLYATFKLPTLKLPKVETDANVISDVTTTQIKDNDVKEFGDPHSIDTPIPLTVKNGDKSTIGAFIFHKFVEISDNTSSYYEQLSKKNLGSLKRHITNVNPSNINDVTSSYQSILTAIEELQGIMKR